MNWDAIGAIAELLGSLAVVVTLVFLTIQLKYNSFAVRNSTVQSQANALADWTMTLAQDAELYSLYRKGLINHDDISGEELGRFDLIMMRVFQANAAIYQQYLNGGMDDESWLDNLKLMAVPFNTPGGQASWQRQKAFLPEKFQCEVARRLT